nr:HNH endonuclease signature motif containing protein [Phytoactinopolyspora alkaliphila]
MRQPGSADGLARVEHPGEFAAEEARAALVWSRMRASATFAFAWDVHQRLPMLGEAMYAGVLDEPRARAFVQWTTELTDEQAAQIIAQLLPQAPGLLVGELIDRIKRAAIAIDPDWAERRYRRAVKGRRVEGSRNDDGSVDIRGRDLPVDRAAAAYDRIDTLARACKRAGDRRRIDHIRADLFLGMLDATFELMSDKQIITHVLNHPFTDHDDHDGDGCDDGSGGDQGDDGGGGDQGDDGSGSEQGDDGTGDDSGGHGGHGDDSGGHGSGSGSGSAGIGGGGASDGDRGSEGGGDGGGQQRPIVGPGTSSVGRASDGEGLGTSGSGEGGGSGDGDPPGGLGGVASGWSVRELRIELATLVGLNERPAEIPGWDFVPASLGRGMVAAMTDAQWRWVVCDHHGRAVDCGLTRRRPRRPPGSPSGSPSGRASDRRRRGMVEVHVSLLDLDALLACARDRDGAWTAVIHDIVNQYRAGAEPPGRSKGRGDGATGTVADAASGLDGGFRSADVAAQALRDACRRVARAGLRRVVQVRDRSCTHPACRAPATRTDQDHARRHADGGLSIAENLGSCCRHDHRLKDEGGWRVRKPAPDLTVWHSPLGHRYLNRVPPVIPPLPRPRPGVAGDRYDNPIEVNARLARIRAATARARPAGADRGHDGHDHRRGDNGGRYSHAGSNGDGGSGHAQRDGDTGRHGDPSPGRNPRRADLPPF